MAKSFKKLQTTESSAKKESEKDYLDLLGDNASNKGEQHSTTFNNIQQHNVNEVADIADSQENIEVRATFMVHNDYLEKMKDYVYTRRKQGEYYYTQTQALHDAFDLLFKDIVIEKRPENVRKKEEFRKERIRQGKGK